MVARTQAEHEAINAVEYPGTRQLCVCCDSPTGRCEEDSIFLPPKDPNGNGLGPLCEECCDAYLVPNDQHNRLVRVDAPVGQMTWGDLK